MASAFSYHVFSLETWKNWEKSGKSEFVDKITQCVNNDSRSNGHSKTTNLDNLSLALYDIVLAVSRSNLRRDFAKTVLLEMLPLHPEMSSQLVEIVSIVEAEILNGEKPSKQRDTLLSFVKMLDLEKLYKERLEIDTLGDAGILKNKKNFLVKQIKVRTKLFYKQQKFNLLREESEGYAKLITELNQEITHQITPSRMIQVIRGLIGCFNLDPNRVLDLILEAFEYRPEEHAFYSALLHLFPHEASTVSEIVGFKLNNSVSDGKEPRNLYRLMALLLQANVLQLSDVYDWLTPEDTSMCDDHKREMEEARDFAQRANVVSTKDKDKEKEKVDEEEEHERYLDRRMNKFASNQKLQLCVALLKVGNWTHFLEMCSRFPDYYLVSCLPVSQALCSLVNDLIEPLYKKHNGLPSKLLKGDHETPPPTYAIPPLCRKFDDMMDHVFPMLCTLGPYIYHDVRLMYRILRVCRASLKESKDQRGKWYYEFLSVLDECILPSLSMFDLNPCIAEEIWETIKYYPYQHRYKLYGRWKNETCNLHPPLLRNKTILLKKAKYVMMRITKETIKPVSRGIGKLSHDFPGPIFEYVLKQVQLYDNLITPVVDSFKYLTSLSYDVLGYCIVEILTLSKDRTQCDAMAISPWLQSLSSFTGSLCKKYPLDLGGILQFVGNQLKAEKSIDLLVLKDIVQKMGGTDSMANLTPEQLEAMCGGELLRKEAGQYLQEKNTKRSSIRLKESLMENDLAVPLLLLMAQQRSSIIYNQTESRHLKLVGKLYDQCQDTMVQFGSHLSQMVTIEELSQKLPSIGSLLSDYHITADVAFFLARPMFSHLLMNKYDELRRKDKGEKKLSGDDKKKIFMDACKEAFSPIVELIRPTYSSKVWEDVDPWFFLTFWTLNMSDLDVPVHIYEKENKKIAELIAGKSRKRDIERLTSLKEKLEDEKKRQLDHVDRVNAWLLQEKDSWFKQRTARSPKNDTVTTFLQLCVFPRCNFTTTDAIYCARFVRMLHSLKTPNFSTLLCYDKMYCDITYTVTSCTEQEAHNYARFLLGTLETVMHWHACSENFEEECAKYPGFITRYRISKHEANDYVDYQNYRHVVHKWHYKITKALVTCLESGNYIQIRNAIFILQGILPCFPAIINLALVIEKRIERVKMAEKNQRNDLYVLANSYSGRLKSKKSSLIEESEFHIVRTQGKSQAQKTQSTDAMNGQRLEKEDKPQPKKPIEAPSKSGSDRSEEKNDSEKDSDSKKREKRKDDKEDKIKKKRDSKRQKFDDNDDDEQNHHEGGSDLDGEADQRNHNAESAKASANGSFANSGKMDPPATDAIESGRGSKRRKVEQDAKVAKKDEESRKDRKRTTRSNSAESDMSSSPKDGKKEKRERKRSTSPVTDEKKLRKSLRSH